MKKEYHKHNGDSKRWQQKVGSLLQKDKSQTAKTTSTVHSGRMRCMRWGAVICLPRANAIRDVSTLIALVVIALKMGSHLNSRVGVLAPAEERGGEPDDESSCEPEDFMCSNYSGCNSVKKRAWR
jgi:hypothetical protein